MLLDIALNIDWQDLIFYIICGIVSLFVAAVIPEDFWHFFAPFIVIGLIFIGIVTYIIWYLTSYKAGWYDLSYWSVFGIGVGISVSYFVIRIIIDKIKEK